MINELKSLRSVGFHHKSVLPKERGKKKIEKNWKIKGKRGEKGGDRESG